MYKRISKTMKIIILKLFLAVNIAVFAVTDLVQIGNHEDKGSLFSPGQIMEGPDANIYVYDSKDSYIKVFSPKGEFLKNMAGPGEGPGLIKRPDLVHFGFTREKYLFFTEYFGGHRWITLLKPDGSFLETVNPKLPQRWYGIVKAFALNDGTYLIEFAFTGPAKKKGNFFLHSSHQTIYHMDAKGNIISKIKENEFFTRISYFKRGADLGIPYAPFNYWAPFKKDSILFTDGLDNALLVISSSGKIICQIETELPEVPIITDKDITQWCIDIKSQMSQTQSDKEWYRKFGKVIEEYKDPVYKKKPYIQSLQVTVEGNIFISAITEPGTTTRNFWLLSPEGKILSYTKLDIFEFYIFPHYIFVKKKDADENMSVCYFKRCGDEISDFKALVERLKKNNAAMRE
jgi:hypothetical protein